MEAKVTGTVTANKQRSLSIVSLAPTKLVPPFLKPLFLALPPTYLLIEAREVGLKMTVEVQLLLQWLRGCLQDNVPGMPSLGDLYLEDCLTNRRILLIWELV